MSFPGPMPVVSRCVRSCWTALRRTGCWRSYGDRLVGKLDAAADRKAGVLRVNALHEDVPFTKTMSAEIGGEIEDLARWLELELVLPG